MKSIMEASKRVDRRLNVTQGLILSPQDRGKRDTGLKGSNVMHQYNN